MKIKTIIVDKVPSNAVMCPKFRGLFIEPNYNGVPVMVVDCALFGHEIVVKMFNHLLERCIFCPLMIEEEYKAKLECIDRDSAG